MGDIRIISKSVTIPSAMIGERDVTVTLYRTGDDSPWHPGKPLYRWTITDGEHTMSGDDLSGWGDAREMARSLCSFLANDLERAEYSGDNTRDASGDPIGPYTAEDWAFLVAYSETLSAGSVEPDEDDEGR